MNNILFILVCCVALVGCETCIEGDCENGQGTYTCSDGGKYVGEWKSGLMNGQGTATNSDGIILHSGLWKDGKPVK